MRYVPTSRRALLQVLENQPDDRKVEVDADTGVSASTVKDLRLVPSWPGELAVDVPSEDYPELTVKISKAE